MHLATQGSVRLTKHTPRDIVSWTYRFPTVTGTRLIREILLSSNVGNTGDFLCNWNQLIRVFRVLLILDILVYSRFTDPWSSGKNDLIVRHRVDFLLYTAEAACNNNARCQLLYYLLTCELPNSAYFRDYPNQASSSTFCCTYVKYKK